MTLGEKLQALRTEAGLSQEELAERLDVSRQAVSKWELDKTTPDVRYIVALSGLFQVSTDYLLGLERLTTVDVTGLADRDVAVLAELAERLKNCKD